MPEGSGMSMKASTVLLSLVGVLLVVVLINVYELQAAGVPMRRSIHEWVHVSRASGVRRTLGLHAKDEQVCLGGVEAYASETQAMTWCSPGCFMALPHCTGVWLVCVEHATHRPVLSSRARNTFGMS